MALSLLTNFPIDLLDTATLISRADKHGKITYVNCKFTEVSGWTLDDVKGKDHNIVNSGRHSKDFWQGMYTTVLQEKKIWHDIVVNRAKDGSLYYVDTYIKAEFDEKGEHTGFTSIRQDVSKIYEVLNELDKKNAYLEHAAKILRHDMHSGINTYIPRGITSLERRLTKEVIRDYKLEAPLRLIKEGLLHSQKVYRGVKEFTNLVKEDKSLEKQEYDLHDIIKQFLSTTAYKDQVIIDKLCVAAVNESLFCTAVDNLIRNGLKYNDAETKFVRVFMFDSDTLGIQDNGRGMSQQDFDVLSRPYIRREGQKESGTGLGLSICTAIMTEHGFSVSCEKLQQGTLLKVKVR